MIYPTPEIISEIIEKLKTLRDKVTDFINRCNTSIDETADQVERKEKSKGDIAELAGMIKEHKQIQSLRNEVDILLCPYSDYLKEKGSWGEQEQARMETAIKSWRPADLDIAIQELEKIKYKMQVEAKQPAAEKPTERGQESEPVKEPKANNLAKQSQSVRTTALSSAAAQLKQIADNFENWAKKQSARFVDPNGVKPPAFTLAQIEDWVNTYLLKQRLVAVFFSHPHLSYDKNSGLTPFLTTYERKEFHLIIDVFRLHMPAIATSLKELYDEFWKDVRYHIESHERSKKVQQENIPSIGESIENTFWHPPLFLDGTVARLVRRLRHIAEIAKQRLKPEEPAETGREIKPDEQKIINILKEYENEHGNKVGITPADLECEVEMTWPKLRPVLDSLGRKGLIEGHKGDGYISYWLSVEFDKNDPLKHCCNIKKFRLTPQGRERYTIIAEKTADAEQGNHLVTKKKADNWGQVSVDIIDNDTLRYKIGTERWKRVHLAEVGFMDKRKSLPNKLWPIFQKMAKNSSGGYIDIHTPENISKDVDRICNILKGFFGPSERPIRYNKKAKRYVLKFSLSYRLNA